MRVTVRSARWRRPPLEEGGAFICTLHVHPTCAPYTPFDPLDGGVPPSRRGGADGTTDAHRPDELIELIVLLDLAAAPTPPCKLDLEGRRLVGPIALCGRVPGPG